jgi:hypothetical protein
MNSNTCLKQSASILLTALFLLGGCKRKPEVAPAPVPSEAIVSAEKTCFNEVTAKLNRGGNLYVFLDTQQTLTGLSNRLVAFSNLITALPNIPGDGRASLDRLSSVLTGFVEDSGLGRVSGFGASSVAREKGFYYSKVVLYHYPGENAGAIWSLFGKSPHPLDGLDFLPESTALAVFSDFDLPLAWAEVDQELAKLDIPGVAKAFDEFPAHFHEHTGLQLDDALRSLGGEYGLIVTLDAHKKITLPIPNNPVEIPSPGLAIVARVNSEIIFNRVDQALAENKVISKLLSKTDEADFKMRTVSVPIPIGIDLRPSIARSGDYLLLATSDTLVLDILAVKSGKAKGYKETDDFKKLSQGIPSAGNNFSLVTGAFGNTMSHLREQPSMKGMGQVFNSATNTYSYSVGVNGPDGWEAFANGNHSVHAVVVPMAVAAGVAAAIAIPNFIKGRETARYNRIVDNLRRLDIAKRMWATDKGKPEGASVSMDDLASYLQKEIEPVAGEEYILHPVGTPATARLAQSLGEHKAGSEISAE